MLYKDPFRTEQIRIQFMREMILNENEDKLRSVVAGLDLNKIKEYPIENKEALELPE
jgi:hypothetical protein